MAEASIDDDILVSGAHALGIALSSGQRDAFARYRELLLAQNEIAGLTTVVDPVGIQRRHFLESLALLPAMAARGIAIEEDAMLVDIGSGGGFPGVPLAIVSPGLRATLVESHGRRAAFLRQLVEALGLSDRISVLNARAEDAGRLLAEREMYDLAVSRAVAALPVLAELTLPFLRVGGVLAASKGSRASDEIAQAKNALAALGGGEAQIEQLNAPTDVDVRTVLVIVEKIAGTPARYPRRAGVPARRPL